MATMATEMLELEAAKLAEARLCFAAAEVSLAIDGFLEEKRREVPRDELGRWSSSGGGSGGGVSTSPPTGHSAPADAHLEGREWYDQPADLTSLPSAMPEGVGTMRGDMGPLYDRVSRPDGGFTYSPFSHKEPQGGYAVSPYPDRSQATSVADMSHGKLLSYIEKNGDLLAKDDHYLGAWHDPQTHKVYLDVSVVKKTAAEAHDLCKKHDQIAYFDLNNFKSVTVDASATSGGAAKGGHTKGGYTHAQALEKERQKQEWEAERQQRREDRRIRQARALARKRKGGNWPRPRQAVRDSDRAQADGGGIATGRGNGQADAREGREVSLQSGSDVKREVPRDAFGRWCGDNCGGGAGAGSGADGTGVGVVHEPGTESARETTDITATIADEPTTPPPPGIAYKPNLNLKNSDGVEIHSRVGVPADEVPPPPPIRPLPNLTDAERAVEKKFIDRYERDPDVMAAQLRDEMKKVAEKKNDPDVAKTFETDFAKSLSEDWNDADPAMQAKKRSLYNTALHATANACTKRAFVQHLDTLKEGDEILVTAGGCGSGKGYSLGNVAETKGLKSAAHAVWDSAGDQNATEHSWILKEAEKRGLKVTYAYVHADPYDAWASQQKGVVQRANNPKDGRMVDADVFADSYARGAKNHAAFEAAHKDNPNVKFVYVDNSTKNPDGTPGAPKLLPAMPKQAIEIDRKDLYEFAHRTIKERTDLRPEVSRAATIGGRIWKDEYPGEYGE